MGLIFNRGGCSGHHWSDGEVVEWRIKKKNRVNYEEYRLTYKTERKCLHEDCDYTKETWSLLITETTKDSVIESLSNMIGVEE